MGAAPAPDSRRRSSDAPIRTISPDSGRFASDSGRNQKKPADSAQIPAEISRNRPKLAEIVIYPSVFHFFLACTSRLTITIICSAGRAKIIIAIYANRLWGVALSILDPRVANSTQLGSCEHNRVNTCYKKKKLVVCILIYEYHLLVII